MTSKPFYFCIAFSFGCVLSVPLGVNAQSFIDPLTAAIDKDGDGILSAEEIENAPQELQTLDKNDDGKLSTDEIMPQLPGGMRPPGFGGGGPKMEKVKLVKTYDKDGDGRLSREERNEAKKDPALEGGRRGPFGRGRGGPPGFGGDRDAARPGARISPDEVEVFPAASLYDSTVVRTLFVDFEHDDWNEEMAAFKDTDVDIAATLTVDGKVYPNVGVRFRGMSSFGMVPEDYKRSLNVSLDFVDEDQRLYGYKTLNLLNCNGDASMMSSFLYHDIASKKIAAPMSNGAATLNSVSLDQLLAKHLGDATRFPSLTLSLNGSNSPSLSLSRRPAG